QALRGGRGLSLNPLTLAAPHTAVGSFSQPAGPRRLRPRRRRRRPRVHTARGARETLLRRRLRLCSPSRCRAVSSSTPPRSSAGGVRLPAAAAPAQGRGDEDHPRAEADARRPVHPLQGLRRRRRQQRPRRPRRQVRQGGGHGHPRRYHPRQALHRARQEGLLGEQERPAPHRPVPWGCSCVWLRSAVPVVPAPWGSEIVAARVPQKVLPSAGIDDVFTSSRGSTKSHIWQLISLEVIMCLYLLYTSTMQYERYDSMEFI
uniref:Small ribosomal subunit protein uS5 C-terminal domain-containing protein n=1 Tax=Aegilops tauschii subsp. strangulata TaxID=200361 RepID=A0A453GCQ3_AEGTS